MDRFQDIYRTYADEIKKFLICLTSDTDLAEELTQETFYQAVKSIERYNGNCKMSVWLCQIAKHLFYDHLKKQKRYKTMSVDALTKLAIHSTHENPEKQMISKDQIVRIYKFIHSMDEPYREIFLLRTSSELSFREIGEIFDKSENWARVTYYRARLKLSERMQDDEMQRD